MNNARRLNGLRAIKSKQKGLTVDDLDIFVKAANEQNKPEHFLTNEQLADAIIHNRGIIAHLNAIKSAAPTNINPAIFMVKVNWTGQDLQMTLNALDEHIRSIVEIVSSQIVERDRRFIIHMMLACARTPSHTP